MYDKLRKEVDEFAESFVDHRDGRSSPGKATPRPQEMPPRGIPTQAATTCSTKVRSQSSNVSRFGKASRARPSGLAGNIGVAAAEACASPRQHGTAPHRFSSSHSGCGAPPPPTATKIGPRPKFPARGNGSGSVCFERAASPDASRRSKRPADEVHATPHRRNVAGHPSSSKGSSVSCSAASAGVSTPRSSTSGGDTARRAARERRQGRGQSPSLSPPRTPTGIKGVSSSSGSPARPTALAGVRPLSPVQSPRSPRTAVTQPGISTYVVARPLVAPPPLSPKANCQAVTHHSYWSAVV
jgi:hypothetical protein